MRKKYFFEWLLIIAGVWTFVAWISFGKVYVRRKFFSVAPIPEATRTQTQFMAIRLPRISSWRHKYTMSSSELKEFLKSLKTAGYTSVGINDIFQLYSRGQKLPPKALLITFAQDDYRGIEAADAVMESLRLRGVLFISRIGGTGTVNQGRFLTRHAVSQMQRGGAWDFGWIWQKGETPVSNSGKFLALLNEAATHEIAPLKSQPYPLHFTSSEMGFNNKKDNPLSLTVLSIPPNHSAHENLQIVQNSWPRISEFSENFSTDGLRNDWVIGWGIVSVVNHQLELLPTPRQLGAGIFLRGTKNWRDQALEFDLKNYRQEFWAYLRYDDNKKFVRVGAHNGYWYLEQKTGPTNLPSMLARSPIQPGDLPARVRIVLKKESAIVHVNGRMQFGRALRISPAIDRGQMLLGVYGKQSGSAFASLTSVRARPLGEEWISFKSDVPGGFDKERLKQLRGEAVYASVLSPLWVTVSENGRVTVNETQSLLIRSLAGFYGCRLIPMTDFSKITVLSSLGNYTLANKLIADLTDAAKKLDVAGLNLRLYGKEVRNRKTIAFLAKLHATFHAQGWELWVTTDGGRGLDAPMKNAVDGILRASQNTESDFALLKVIQRPSRKKLDLPSTLMQTASANSHKSIYNSSPRQSVSRGPVNSLKDWIPAFAGMTVMPTLEHYNKRTQMELR